MSVLNIENDLIPKIKERRSCIKRQQNIDRQMAQMLNRSDLQSSEEGNVQDEEEEKYE